MIAGDVAQGVLRFADGLLGLARRLVVRDLGLQVGVVRGVADLLLGLALQILRLPLRSSDPLMALVLSVLRRRRVRVREAPVLGPATAG